MESNDIQLRVQQNSTVAHKAHSHSPTLCAHCGSPIIGKSENVEFCCKGCEFVFHTLQGLGLGAYYSLKNAEEKTCPSLNSSAAKKFLYLDDDIAKRDFIEIISPEISKISLYLPGIHCAACIWLLEKLPTVLKGVSRSRVQFAKGEIEIEFNPNIVKPSEIAYSLNSLGYPPVPLSTSSILKANRNEERMMMMRIGVAAFCAANTMMLSVSLFQGFFSGIEEPYASLFRWLSAVIALPAVIFSAYPFYRTAVGALLTGTLHIDLPIAAAVVLTYIAGLINSANGQEFVYFDSVTTLIFLLLLGRFIQSRAISRSRATALSPWDLLPSTVRIAENDKLIEKPLRELQIDDLVAVLPGERIPSDGIIIEGQSSIDNSFITGESLPVEVKKDAAVLAGAINLESKLILKALKIGADSRLGNIFREIEKEQSTRTPMEDRANRLSARFVLAVFFLAAITYCVWNFLDPAKAFDVTVSILIVTCPCALSLAIPAAATISLGRARKRGIFIRRANAFETLADTQNFYFDKTGTLSAGRIVVQEVIGQNVDLLEIADAMVSFAPLHPIAKAITDFCQNSNSLTKRVPINDCKHLSGRGIKGALLNGTTVRLGSLRWLLEEGVQLSQLQKSQIEKFQFEGQSISALALNNSVNLIFALADQIAPGAKGLIDYLKAEGKQVFILSGDSQGAVNSIADKLQIERKNAKGELFPEQKADIISQDISHNCMVGDGLNDAPAMKQCDISIGMRGGIEATIEVASLYISSGSLTDLLDLLKASKKTVKVIRNNIYYATVYNIIGGALAVSGLVNPIVAAVLMPLSSITIISYSLISKTFKTE